MTTNFNSFHLLKWGVAESVAFRKTATHVNTSAMWKRTRPSLHLHALCCPTIYFPLGLQWELWCVGFHSAFVLGSCVACVKLRFTHPPLTQMKRIKIRCHLLFGAKGGGVVLLRKTKSCRRLFFAHDAHTFYSLSPKNFSASNAAMQPMPAAVTA